MLEKSILTICGFFAIPWAIFLWVTSKSLRDIAVKYLDWRWKPRKEDHPDLFITLPEGSLVEMVHSPLKDAIIKWKMLTTIPLILFIGFWIGSAIAIFEIVGLSVTSQETSILPAILGTYFLSLFVASLIIPLIYWYWEWWCENRWIVVTTTKIYVVFVKPVWVSITPFFRFGDKPQHEEQEIEEALEVRLAPDPEDLGGAVTHWIRDTFITNPLSKKYSMSSIMIYSRSSGAETLWPWQAYASGFKECLNQVIVIGKEIERSRENFQRISDEILSDFDIAAWDRSSAMREREKVKNRFQDVYPQTGKSFFLYNPEDPGFWDIVHGVQTPKREQALREAESTRLEHDDPRNNVADLFKSVP